MTTLDPIGGTGKIASMFRRLIGNAMHSSIKELLSEPLQEIKNTVNRLEGDLKRLDAKMETKFDNTNERITALGARLDTRIDDLGNQVMALGARLDQRIDAQANRFDAKFDEFSAQQNRLIEEVVSLKGEVAGQRSDRKLVETIEHRVARIEDRLFAQAG